MRSSRLGTLPRPTSAARSRVVEAHASQIATVCACACRIFKNSWRSSRVISFSDACELPTRVRQYSAPKSASGLLTQQELGFGKSGAGSSRPEEISLPLLHRPLDLVGWKLFRDG